VNLVIDASVVIKAYVPEILSDKAAEVMAQVADGDLVLLAPDLFYPETGNILWKKNRLHELTLAEVDEIVDALSALPIKIEASHAVMPLAVALAIHCGISVYDAMYVTVARIYETKLITADGKLVDALANTEFSKYVKWLGAGIDA
jgi:predicted nucleic acid-binding protein